MKQNNLSNVFSIVAAKYLSEVDAEPLTSNQHEIGGLSSLKALWGEVESGLKIDCTFIYLGENEDDLISEEGSITWYDARKNQTHRGPEWRLYYPGSSVTDEMRSGDLLMVSQNKEGHAIFIVSKQGTTNVDQLLRLFKISEIKDRGFTVIDTSDNHYPLDFSARYILDKIGIEYDYSDETYLDLILEKIGPKFPTTRIFSEFARSTISSESISDADSYIIECMNREELLFRTLEEYLVLDKIKSGFDEVDEFIKYSLSVHNRRKARVGYAFENHLEAIFINRNIQYSRGKMTENRSKPDFLFPSIEAYRDLDFDVNNLTILGVKSSCKDRWRQVLAEAKRIDEKHLITLEPAISDSQINEMQESKLQLVVPKDIIPTYSVFSQDRLINLEAFIAIVSAKSI